MNGLTSSTPSQAAIRLTVSGFLLMQIQSALLLMSPSLDALIGIPEPPEGHWRQRHGR